ncbi:MAG: ATP-binding protein [Roseiflexaceae bacterium]|nr:ATP-binding protein [Roseiflexaceae bacterium]
MYLDRIILQNIRGFQELNFSLARPDGSYAGWTVFTGDNGSGKSTLLKAIAICLTGRDTARALQPSFNRWVRHGAPANEGAIQLEIVRVEGDDELTKQGRNPPQHFSARINLQNGGKETILQTDSASSKTKTPNRTIWAQMQQDGLLVAMVLFGACLVLRLRPPR